MSNALGKLLKQPYNSYNPIYPINHVFSRIKYNEINKPKH